MANKPTAKDPVIKVPRRNDVQKAAEDMGFQRVIVDGEPMITRPSSTNDSSELLNYEPKKRAKVIGPANVASSRG